MKILYGVQGTGNGHTTRARAMAQAFTEQGIKVDYLFSGRAKQDYFDMAEFGDYQVRHGFTFVTHKGEVNWWHTIKKARLGRFISEVNNLDVSHYDVIINDFEPITAWAGRRQGVPVIGVSHQAAFLSAKVPVHKGRIVSRQLIKAFAPANHYLGVHWHPFDDNIIPPFIAHHEAARHVDNKVLVYLPFEPFDAVEAYLAAFPDVEFYCYHKDAKPSAHPHIHAKRPDRQGFLNDLASASGVIANGGFELASEALRHGKKMLIKPLGGQFEQHANAYTLKAFGHAKVMHFLDLDAFRAWHGLANFTPIPFPGHAKPLVDWILAGQWHDVSKLQQGLWQNITLV